MLRRKQEFGMQGCCFTHCYAIIVNAPVYWLQSRLQQTFFGDRLQLVIGQDFPAGVEVYQALVLHICMHVPIMHADLQ